MTSPSSVPAPTRMWPRSSGHLLRLDRGDGHGVDDVVDQRSPRQVVDGLGEALQYRADSDRAGAALHRLIGVVAGVEVWEHQYGGSAGHLRLRHLDRGHPLVDRRVVLDRTVSEQVGPTLLDQL